MSQATQDELAAWQLKEDKLNAEIESLRTALRAIAEPIPDNTDIRDAWVIMSQRVARQALSSKP